MPSKPRGTQIISTKGGRDFFIRCTVACLQRAADAPKSLQSVTLDPVVWDKGLVDDMVQLFRRNHRFESPLSLQSSDEYTGAPRTMKPRSFVFEMRGMQYSFSLSKLGKDIVVEAIAMVATRDE